MSRRAWSLVALFKVAPVVFWLLPVAHSTARNAGVLIAAGFFFGTDIFLLYQLLIPSSQALCRVFTRFETTRAEIWLTIDDGPDPEDTPRILDLLDRHGARATFFLIGERTQEFTQLVAEILRRGHEIAHHTHTHPAWTFWASGPKRARNELDTTLEVLRGANAPLRWFRPPVGIKCFFLGAALADRQLACVGWSIRSHDSILRDPVKVANRVMSKLQPGAIVLMHEGPWLDQQVRVRAMELVLEELAKRKFACVLPDRAQLR